MELSLEDIEQLVYAVYEKGRASVVKAWNESDHPRGQPENAGEFAKTSYLSSESAAIKDYGDSGFIGINSALRNRHPLNKDGKKMVENIDSAIKRTQTASHSVVYRGVAGSIVDHLSVGDVFRDAGYLSTSRNPETARLFQRESPNGKVLVIQVPKKTNYLDVEIHRGDKDQAESLFGRNTAIKIVKVKGNVIYAKMLRKISKSFGPSVIKGGWDESQHPRGDDGRFINKDEISQAARNPKKAAELRQRVTDPAERGKLNAAIGDAGKANRAMGSQYSKPPKDFGAGIELPPARPTSREPGESATTGDHPHGEHPSVDETVHMVRGLRDKSLDQSARGELAERLQGHTVDELKEIKRQLGLRATGRKAELASKILMAAAGHDYPEQGFTGALPVRGQGVHHYEDGVLQRIEREPSPGVHASRMTPEEAHAVIDYHVANGTLLKQETREKIAHMLMHRMSYRDIAELKRRLGLKASGKKQVFADRIQTLVEDRERRARQNPDHAANKPDPMGTMGSLAERLADMEAKRVTYGPGNSSDPARREAIEDAADRLRLAVQSPFAAFNRDSARGEVKAALNDLYHGGELAAAAHLAGIPLDPKDGKGVDQIAAAVFKLAGGDDSPLPEKPKNLLEGLGSEQNATAVPANHTHKITGDTYPHRAAIKRAGGTWDKVGKHWTIDEEGLQYLPDGLNAEPMAHRMPKADATVKPEETKTAYDAVKEQPAEPAKPDTPAIPDAVRKQAEALKQWHQKASRHEVEYQKMLPWTADMIREGDAKTRADVAKRMGALIRKHPELFDEYGPYLKQGPHLPAVISPADHLAKYGHDANSVQIVDDYMNAGGHPNDLYHHLKPEAVNESYSNRMGLLSARTKAARETEKHLASKIPVTQGAGNEPGGETRGSSDNSPVVNGVGIDSGKTVGGINVQSARGSGSSSAAQRSGEAVPDRAEELERERRRGIEDLERLKYGGRTKVEHQEHMKAESARQQAEAEKQYAENIKNPEWVEKQIADHKAYTDRLGSGPNASSNSTDRAAHERYAASLREEHAAATASASAKTPDPTPGRTEHLQAVASAAGHDELRDAADTVVRIESIPHGERTADDRAELKRATELAAAGGADSPSSSGAKNPAQYVDDHPEVTADNPLGLPSRESEPVHAPFTNSSPENGKTPEETAEPIHESVHKKPDTHAAKLADLESKMAEAKAGAANKANGKGDRKVWKRHYGELRAQRDALVKAKKDPDVPDTATTHGKPSAVPIGVTQKEDFESRGRGVRKSAGIESHEYLLPL